MIKLPLLDEINNNLYNEPKAYNADEPRSNLLMKRNDVKEIIENPLFSREEQRKLWFSSSKDFPRPQGKLPMGEWGLTSEAQYRLNIAYHQVLKHN